MIAAGIVVFVVATAVLSEQGVLGRVTHMSVEDEDVEFLDHMKSPIAQVSKEIAAAVNGGFDLESALINVISKDLVMQARKYRNSMHARKDNNTNALCLTCNICNTARRGCYYCMCCIDGYTPCVYTTCATGAVHKVADSDNLFPESTFKKWSDETRVVLRNDVTQLVMTNAKPNEQCCDCKPCTRQVVSCGETQVCCSEGEACNCTACPSRNADLISFSFWGPRKLSPQVEKVIDKVGDLLDKLPLFVI